MLVASKATIIDGKPYEQGQKVDVSALDVSKVQQLIAQRVLRDTSFAGPQQCIVLRDVRVNGKLHERGTKVNVSRLPPGKVAQLLDHRILGLVTT